jgi:hypothetical protein
MAAAATPAKATPKINPVFLEAIFVRSSSARGDDPAGPNNIILLARFRLAKSDRVHF